MVLLSVLVALAVYLYILYSGKIMFRPPLFHFNKNSVTTLSLSSAQEEIIFAKGDQGWTVSDGKRDGFFIPGPEIYAILEHLTSLRPNAMWSGRISPPLPPDDQVRKVMKVRLLFENRPPETFWVEKANAADGRTYLQIDGQEEVFSIPVESVAFCFRPFSYYQDRTFAFPPLREKVDSITYISAGDSLPTLFFLTPSAWHFLRADTLSPDSLAFVNWWDQIGRLLAPDPSPEFDEVQEAQQADKKLTFWTKGRTLLELEGFYRSYLPQPYFVHSSQRPGDYFACDSSGIFKQLFTALDSIIQQSVNH